MIEGTAAHIWIFASVIALLFGVGAILTVVRAREGRDDAFLPPLLWFLTAWNVYLLAGFTTIYTTANIFANRVPEEHTILTLVLSLVTQVSLVAMVWALVHVTVRLGGRTLTGRWLHLGRGGAVFLALVLAAVSVGVFLQLPIHDEVMVVVTAVAYLLYAVFILAPLALLITARKLADEAGQRRARTFSFAYLAIFGLLCVISFMPLQVRVIAAVVILPAINIAALLWTRRFLPPPVAGTGNGNGVTIDDPALLDAFCTRYEFSRREREIAALIVGGKSNKEIEDELYISIHTVKNHIYRLFRKLGVNSRGQLMNLLVEEQKLFNGSNSGDSPAHRSGPGVMEAK